MVSMFFRSVSLWVGWMTFTGEVTMKMTKMRALVVGCSGVAVEAAVAGRLDGRVASFWASKRSLATQNNYCSKVVSHHIF